MAESIDAKSVSQHTSGQANGHAAVDCALLSSFQDLVVEHSQRSGSLSPLRRPGDHGVSSVSAVSWRALGDSPSTARASRRHRSQPFFIGVAGEERHAGV